MKQLTLSAKLALGFGLVFLIVALLLGFIVMRVNAMRGLSEQLGQQLVPMLIASQELTGAVGLALDNISSYSLSGQKRYLEQGKINFKAADEAGRKLLEGLSGPQLAASRARVSALLDKMGRLASYTDALAVQIEDHESGRRELGLLARRAEELLGPLTETGGEAGRRRALAVQAQIWRRLAILWEGQARDELAGGWPAERLDSTFEAEAGRNLTRLYDDLDNLKTRLGRISTAKSEAQESLRLNGTAMMSDLEEFSREAQRLSENVLTLNSKAGDQITSSVIVGLLAALILTVLSVFVLLRSTVRPLRGIIGHFEDGAAEVTDTADHLSRSSRLLAKGVSENTAAVLEAISSLEEMLSMAKRNAGHSARAKDLMDQAKDHVQTANGAMQEISVAMDEIRDSSRASSQIIKTVEEIAFQTNILALNAAVEAARAGEAGVGFAVVADEVRNLANSSSEAAKNTAVILAGSMDRITQGSTLVQNAEESFSAMVATSDQMSGIVEEIAQASQSQAQDIQNIHQSIALMDKVTQENAAGAGETQSLSTNLTRQAALLSEALEDMIVILSGRRRPGPARPPLRAAPVARQARKKPEEPGFSLEEHLREKPAIASSVVDSGKKSKLEAAIPMDDEDWD